MFFAITDVCLMGLYSKNLRIYPVDIVMQSKSLFAGVPVFMGHPNKKTEKRNGVLVTVITQDQRKQIGNVENPYFMHGKGIFGDVVFLDSAKDTYYELLDNPKVAGFSPVLGATTHTDRGIVIVDEIQKVISVDLIPVRTMGGAATTADIYTPYTSKDIARFIKTINGSGRGSTEALPE